MVTDPWSCGHNNQTSSSSDEISALKFEDNFTPSVQDTLPDSAQYLASLGISILLIYSHLTPPLLEKRLRDIKNDPDILKQLREKREACLQNLLNSNRLLFEDSDDNLDLPVGNSQILRAILPQKAALNRGEIVDLVNYDQLEVESSDSESQ